MSTLALLLVGVCIALDTAEQALFRMAAHRPAWYVAFVAPGICIYLVSLCFWLWLLKLMPLGVALPMMGTTHATIALASRWLFKERVDAVRWLGIVLVIAGLALVTMQAK